MRGCRLPKTSPNLQQWHSGGLICPRIPPPALFRALNDTRICTTSIDCLKSSLVYTAVEQIDTQALGNEKEGSCNLHIGT